MSAGAADGDVEMVSFVDLCIQRFLFFLPNSFIFESKQT